MTSPYILLFVQSAYWNWQLALIDVRSSARSLYAEALPPLHTFKTAIISIRVLTFPSDTAQRNSRDIKYLELRRQKKSRDMKCTSENTKLISPHEYFVIPVQFRFLTFRLNFL